MKTCSTCTYATTQKVWRLFPVPYCGHPASAHPVTGAPTLPCATAREGHSCESCRPAHCGIDARFYRAPDAPQRPRWLPDVAGEPSVYGNRVSTEQGSGIQITDSSAAKQQAQHYGDANPRAWIQTLSDAVHGVKR